MTIWQIKYNTSTNNKLINMYRNYTIWNAINIKFIKILNRLTNKDKNKNKNNRNNINKNINRNKNKGDIKEDNKVERC